MNLSNVDSRQDIKQRPDYLDIGPLGEGEDDPIPGENISPDDYSRQPGYGPLDGPPINPSDDATESERKSYTPPAKRPDPLGRGGESIVHSDDDGADDLDEEPAKHQRH